jgi:hypothetical protein
MTLPEGAWAVQASMIGPAGWRAEAPRVLAAMTRRRLAWIPVAHRSPHSRLADDRLRTLAEVDVSGTDMVPAPIARLAPGRDAADHLDRKFDRPRGAWR